MPAGTKECSVDGYFCPRMEHTKTLEPTLLSYSLNKNVKTKLNSLHELVKMLFWLCSPSESFHVILSIRFHSNYLFAVVTVQVLLRIIVLDV